MIRIGAIGVDTSHLPEFSRRLKEMHDAGTFGGRVTAMLDVGDHGWPDADQVSEWVSTAADLGVERVGSMDDLLGTVDAVMVLAIDGNRHLELATAALERGLPTYIDKPLTCDVDQAKQILKLSRANDARCYSASSLRFATELESIPSDLGGMVAIDAFGPGELNATMPGVFHYGVHTIEMVDAIWGPGVSRVSAVAMADRHLVDLEYRDGRYARLRLDRKAAYDFGATIQGDEKSHQFLVDFGPVYTRLVAGMAGFFEGKSAPADLRDIVENVTVMAAANESIGRDGGWVDVPTIE
ncbi:MAG: Gfo/Idh/MocA family oxidoreductase [Planctomycetota bacterium]